MSKFKVMYSFTVPVITEGYEDVPQVFDGKEYVIKEKVKVETPVEFCIRKPTRSLFDEADFFYNATVGEGLMGKLLSAALLAKRFENDGGVMSENEKQAWADKFTARYNKEIEYQKLAIIPEEQRSAEQNLRFKELVVEIALVGKELQNYELREQSLYDITAEARARKLTVGWWLLQLLHKKEKNDWVPFFKGASHKEREESFDDLQDEDLNPKDLEFNKAVIDHAYKAVALWYYARASTQEDFSRAIKEMDKANTPRVEVAAPEEPAIAE